ncbi:hypothetical protein EST38_g13219 [Candolleomyces aberdarensis]|uniref:CCHC-type domain-containing protein n=1 Tax=Candolleomyces aberdarensis TaxID=2316362 RepID=A0A4Q2D387_9AGAR|nr:hypothetical protein EST38_g13219 [Candolleomyces aberdarensis]
MVGSETGSTSGGNSGPKRQVKTMPAAYSGKHPTYDPANPATATRFFDGVELAAKVAGLTDHDEEVVEHALTYLDTQTARLWSRLEGGSAPFSFEKWRKAVMKILPKASRYDVGSMARLDDLCRKARERPIGRDEKSAFYEFALGFQAEAEPLLKSGVIANRDLVVKFISGLKGTFREGLSERLSRKTPVADADGAARDEEDPFTMEEVIKVATDMVDAAAVGPFGSLAYVEEEADYARNVTSSGLSDRAESAGLKDLKIKQESMTEEMAKVYTTLDRVEKSMSLLTTQFDTFTTTARTAPAPAQAPYRPSNQAVGQRPGMYTRPAGASFSCWYCGQNTHTISQCPEVRQGIENGRITQRGNTIFCKGNVLAREVPEGTTMKARVDAMWKGPTQADLNLLEEYDELEAEAFDVFYQHHDEPVTHSVLQQSMEQMKKEQNAFLNRISQQLRPAQPAAPKIEPPKEVSTREVLEQLCELSKRFDNVEQFQLQTRRAAASGNQEDF